MAALGIFRLRMLLTHVISSHAAFPLKTRPLKRGSWPVLAQRFGFVSVCCFNLPRHCPTALLWFVSTSNHLFYSGLILTTPFLCRCFCNMIIGKTETWAPTGWMQLRFIYFFVLHRALTAPHRVCYSLLWQRPTISCFWHRSMLVVLICTL